MVLGELRMLQSKSIVEVKPFTHVSMQTCSTCVHVIIHYLFWKQLPLFHRRGKTRGVHVGYMTDLPALLTFS